MSLAFVPMNQRGKVSPNQTSIQKVVGYLSQSFVGRQFSSLCSSVFRTSLLANFQMHSVRVRSAIWQ